MNLGNCNRLQQLLESLGQLSCRPCAAWSWPCLCSCLEQVPASLGRLSALRSLNLGECSGLEELPESLGRLTALSSRNLAGSSSLEQLPESLALRGLTQFAQMR
jgi:hypothetical protein